MSSRWASRSRARPPYGTRYRLGDETVDGRELLGPTPRKGTKWWLHVDGGVATIEPLHRDRVTLPLPGIDDTSADAASGGEFVKDRDEGMDKVSFAPQRTDSGLQAPQWWVQVPGGPPGAAHGGGLSPAKGLPALAHLPDGSTLLWPDLQDELKRRGSGWVLAVRAGHYLVDSGTDSGTLREVVCGDRAWISQSGAAALHRHDAAVPGRE